MNPLLRQFFDTLLHAARNLLPIIIVVGLFQFAVLQQMPEGLGSMIIGLLIVVLGVALFLQGLEMGVFPIGKSLSDEFAAKGSLPWLMIFGFFNRFFSRDRRAGPDRGGRAGRDHQRRPD